MSRRDELIAAIRQELGTAFAPPLPPLGPSPQASRARRTMDAHLYEQYAWTLILKAGRREGATLSYWDVFGNPIAPPATMVFRAGPGQICSRKRPYTHARLVFPELPPLEAHIGVLVEGTSNVVHECDVLVLTQAEAETCRRQRVLPRSSQVILGVECKMRGSDLELREGRGFLGLTLEFPKGKLFFVSDTRSASVMRLLEKKNRRWEHQVFPIPATLNVWCEFQ